MRKRRRRRQLRGLGTVESQHVFAAEKAIFEAERAKIPSVCAGRIRAASNALARAEAAQKIAQLARLGYYQPAHRLQEHSR